MGLVERLMFMVSDVVNATANPVLGMHWLGLAAIGFSGVALWLIGKRFSSVAKPDSPYLSPILRSVGSWAKVLGILVTGTGASWTLLVLLLLFVHQTLSGYAPSSAAVSAWLLLWKHGQHNISAWVAGSAAAAAISLPLIWRVIPSWERGDGLPDIKQMAKLFKKLDRFDPLTYIDVKQGCFIGRDDRKVAIYVPWPKLRETHVQVLGMTGSGKGVAMSLIAYQSVLAGECLLWFDPKYDRYSPRILEAAAKRAGQPFHLVNLRLCSEIVVWGCKPLVPWCVNGIRKQKQQSPSLENHHRNPQADHGDSQAVGD